MDQTSASIPLPPHPDDTETACAQHGWLVSPYVQQELDRRAQPRRLGCQFVYVRRRAEPEVTYQLIILWNVSPAGVGLFLNHAFQPGTELCLQFRRPAIEDRVATVVHATPCETGWLVGCALDRPLSLVELQAIEME
jgi:hypothetical protein